MGGVPANPEYFAVKLVAVATHDIPAPLAREVGRFIVAWAHLEHYVQQIIFTALGLEPEEGRIAVREARFIDRLDMMRDIVDFQKREMDFVLLGEIKGKAAPLAGFRNLMAHALWQKFDDSWCVLVTRGIWENQPVEIVNYPKGIKKNLAPEGFPVSVDKIRGWTSCTVALIEDIKRLGDQHRPLPASPRRSRKRRQPKDRDRGQTG